MSDLAGLADLEAWLGLPAGNPDEALLERLVGAVGSAAQAWCARSFASLEWTETRDGTGGRRLAFANTPVTAVSGVTIDGVAIPPSPGAPERGYLWSETAVTLIGWRFTRGLANVELAYTAGYATVPPDVTQAVLEWAAHAYREKDRIGMTSESLGGQTTSFLVKDMPLRVAALLQPYRHVVPA
ncbi:MAG TPA: head-tail connector protein [Stellaceae bacterium]|nr:head-tail connector protein [Stellaceae bacterium]